MKMHKPLVIMLVAMLGACASNDRDRNAAPAWVNGEDARFPRAAYLTGVGSADALDTARDRARADLAKTFRVAIDERSSDTRSYMQSDNAAGASSEYTAELQRDLSTRTQQVLEGVTIPETWTDPAGRIYALAVLNRSTAAMRLRQEITQLDGAAESLLARARASNDAFDRARMAIQVVDNQRKRAAVQGMLQAVDISGRGVTPQWPLAKLEADLATALSRIEMRAGGKGDWKNMIAGKLASAGFTVVEDAPYAANLSVEVVQLPQRQGWHWRRAVAVLDVTGPGNRSLGQQRWEMKESATDAGTADFRVKEAIAGQLDKEARNAVLAIVAGNR